MRTLRMALLLAGTLVFVSTQAKADVMEVAASAFDRITNPEDSGDVRVLCAFTLPDEVTASRLVSAILTVGTSGESVTPIVVDLFEQAWSGGSTWANLAGSPGTELVDGEGSGLKVLDSEDIVAATDVDESVNPPVDNGVRVDVTEYMRAWLAERGVNTGICLRRVPGRGEAMGEILPSTAEKVRLTLVFTES